ncbi:hypothetical protein HLA99_01815 [Microbacterium ulmi]|uniref:Uncharacterized protein n=2 Tax=Microbacterium ulmi TaxID=179095 RepID=A0A7Y2LYR8_9MICO|nr:hypothetical protein [Microbacterium ulmi]
MPVWLLGTIMGLFGLFYAYAVWNAIANLIQTAQFFGDAGRPLNAFGWAVWIFAIVFPVIVYVFAFRLSHRRPAHHALLIMLTGLGLVAVFWLDLVAYTALSPSSLLS